MAWDREKDRKAGKFMAIGVSIFAILFVLFWCAIVSSMGAWIMLIPGLLILGFLIFRLTMAIRMGKETSKEKDPWEGSGTRRDDTAPTQSRQSGSGSASSNSGGFCPYCGEETKDGFAFCPKCGRRLQ
ncbi:MAG: zinc-ribbon domain-containing protein [Faecousia sp.]